MVRELPEDEQDEDHEGQKGEVVSYAMWNYFVGRKEEDGGGDGAYYEEWPSDVNKEAIKVLFDKGKKKREETMGDGDYARTYDVFCQLSVSPCQKLQVRHKAGFEFKSSMNCRSFRLFSIFSILSLFS